MSATIGVALSPSSADLATTSMADLAAAVVESGFASLWTLDNPLADQAEPLVFLTSAASLAPTLGVGTAAIVGPVRDPILLAKQVATLDRITGGGRVTLGLTIGRRTDEYDLIGHDFRRRGRMLEDLVHVLKQCWSGEPIQVDGAERSWKSSGPVGVPPATPGGPQVLLGGHAPAALERCIRVADGYLGSATGGPKEAIAALGRVHDLVGASPRDASAFRCTTNVFVVIAKTRDQAIEAATATFVRRHGGRKPPWDPADVVIGGPPGEVADGVAQLVDAGYAGVNLVPVLGTLEQVRALTPVVTAVSGAPTRA